MERTLEIELTKRATQFVDTKLGDYAETVYESPVENYTSPDRLRAEVEQIFRRSPVIAGLSFELARPGDHKTLDIIGLPVLVSRDRQGKLNAFLNACRHRGAKVVEADSGKSSRFVCPYHGWVYDSSGKLCGVGGTDTAFADMDREDRGLVPLPVAERHGLIWVVPDPQAAEIDLDAYLGPLDADLPQVKLNECVLVERYVHQVDANWKLVMETFLENYHLKALHRKTLAPLMISYATLHDPMGTSQRMVYPGTALEVNKDRPADDWSAFNEWGISVIYNLFPNTILVTLGDHYQLFQIFPGKTPGTSTMIQNVLARNAEHMEQRSEALAAQANLLTTVLRTEDLHQAQIVQAGLASGANKTMVFGRNEIPAHHFHQQLNSHLS